jgi:DNA-binding MarR family transcriptional regulator
MSDLAASMVSFCRLFASYERDAVCCGTVTVPQCVVLQTLREGEWDVSTLAASNHVTNGAMTRLIDGLEKRGFVERTRSDEDRRRVEVRLTRAGRSEADRLASLTEQAVQRLIDRVPAAKKKHVVESLELLRQAAEQLGDAARCC